MAGSHGPRAQSFVKQGYHIMLTIFTIILILYPQKLLLLCSKSLTIKLKLFSQDRSFFTQQTYNRLIYIDGVISTTLSISTPFMWLQRGSLTSTTFAFRGYSRSVQALRSKRNRNPNRKNLEIITSDTKSENPLVCLTKTENQMRRKTDGLRHKYGKTVLKNSQNRKTENPNTPFPCMCTVTVFSLQ